MMQTKTYTTQEIATAGKVHPNTVRLYEKWGFIAKAERRGNNYRVFYRDHLEQMKLARIALPGPYPLDGKIVQQMVREFACKNFTAALSLAELYLHRTEAEKQSALQALQLLDQWFACRIGDKNKILLTGRKEAARAADVSVDALRTWERNGLYNLHKDSRGRLIFSEWDMEKIAVIRLLRNCGYSISSLLRVFTIEDPVMERPSLILTLPDQEADFFYITDLFLVYLEQHLDRAESCIHFIKDYMKNNGAI